MKIKAARVNANLTQKEMADKLNMCKNTYLAIEHGRKHMTVEQVNQFSDACGCRVSDLDCDVLVLVKASTLS